MKADINDVNFIRPKHAYMYIYTEQSERINLFFISV